MESFLSLFIFHDSYVVSFLVLGIAVIVIFLLLFNNKSPESVVKSEMGGADNIEGALRRVLGEQRWAQNSDSTGEESPEQLAALEKEVLQKDKAIAELNKKLTQSGAGDGSGDSGDSTELMNKIADLESKLQEYEIIEDDIADLSLYRAENEKLKNELDQLKALAGSSVTALPDEEEAPESEELEKPKALETSESEVVVEEAPAPEVTETAVAEEPAPSGTDLVAEFEKVVNSQDELADGDDEVGATNLDIQDEEVSGEVIVDAPEKEEGSVIQEEVQTHERLKDVNPGSKEEAEVFISDLKSLRKANE